MPDKAAPITAIYLILRNYTQGWKRYLKKRDITFRLGSFSHRTSIDQRGEQTINKNAKTAGGIEKFASDPSGVLKWVLIHPEQARNTEKMIELAGLQSTCEFKPLRRS